jgi:hypothetical protein
VRRLLVLLAVLLAPTTQAFALVTPSITGHSSASSIKSNDVVRDIAEVGGPSSCAGAPPCAPIGAVRFFLCRPPDVTAGGCVTGGKQIGGNVPLFFFPPFTPTAFSDLARGSDIDTLGTYCWRAEFIGNDLWGATSFTNTTTQCFTVEPIPPPAPLPMQIPTLSEWTMILLTAVLVLVGAAALHRRAGG